MNAFHSFLISAWLQITLKSYQAYGISTMYLNKHVPNPSEIFIKRTDKQNKVSTT